MNSDPIEDDGVLSPEELQLEDDRVRELEGNRYVVQSDGSADASATGDASATDTASSAAAAAGDVPATDDRTAAGGRVAHADDSAHADAAASATADALANAPEPHGIDVTLKTDGEIARHRGTSHDVREVFVDLLEWYADQLDDDLSAAEALEVMLATSDLEV